MLRLEAGRHPHDKQLVGLIGELSTRSEEFRIRWAAHNVRFHRTGTKTINHPIVGRLDLTFEAMEFPAHPGLTLLVYTAPAGTPTADGLSCSPVGPPARPRRTSPADKLQRVRTPGTDDSVASSRDRAMNVSPT